MKTKRLALAMVAVMLASACIGLFIADSTDDAEAAVTGDFVPKHPKLTETGSSTGLYNVSSFTIKINQSAIDESNSVVTNKGEWHTWTDDSKPKVGEKIGDLKTIAPVSGKNVTMSITPVETTKSFFTVSFKTESYDGSAREFNVAYRLTTTSNLESLTQDVFYKVILNKNQEVKLKTVENVDAVAVIGEEMKPIGLEVDGDSILGTWYATGLPAGLAMNSKGVISGVPLDASDSGKDFNVFITDYSGNVHNGTFKLTLTSKSTLSITGYSSNVKYIGTDTLDKSGLNRYMMYTNEIGTFELTCTDVSGKLTVHVVDNVGGENTIPLTVDPVKANTYKFSVTPSGTGDLTVIVTDNDRTAMFTILVLDKIQDVKADIYFDLQPKK